VPGAPRGGPGRAGAPEAPACRSPAAGLQEPFGGELDWPATTTLRATVEVTAKRPGKAAQRGPAERRRPGWRGTSSCYSC